MKSVVLFLATGLAAIVSAQIPLTTINPCPSCPESVKPSPITVTSQYQPVSTCTPRNVCTSSSSILSACQVKAECSTYAYVSTVIPYLGGRSTTTVTNTDAIVTLDHASTVLTSLVPRQTIAPQNGTVIFPFNSTQYHTLVVDTWSPYRELGPLAIPGYPGSGLCRTCEADENGTRSQVVTVKNCFDSSCSTYTVTWIATRPVPATTTSRALFSSQTFLPSGGQYVIPVTVIYTPFQPEYRPAVQTFAITTSVNAAVTIQITRIINITFLASPVSTALALASAVPLSTSTLIQTNGVQTIPIIATIIPTVPGFTIPIIINIFYTINIINAPQIVPLTTTVTVTFTSTVPGSTTTSTPPTVPASTTASTTTTVPANPTSSTVTTVPASSTTSTVTNVPASSTTSTVTTVPASSTSTTASTTSTATSGPQPVAAVGLWEFVACLGSRGGFPSFILVETSGSMTPTICTDECEASGFLFAGLWTGECYCAPALDAFIEVPGQCTIPCPGDPALSCGGNTTPLRARAVDSRKLLDVYEFSPPTSTSTTSGSTSTTTSATSDPSSDPDPEPVKRSLDADMELNEHKGRAIKLRRGGMLRGEKKETANLRVKRDFGMKQPFGL